MFTPVDSTAPSLFPSVCTFYSRTHGHACWFYSTEFVSKILYFSFSYPWSRLLILHHRASFQVSVPFILVPMHTPVDCITPSLFPSFCIFHSRIHGTPVDSRAMNCFPRVYTFSFSYPWTRCWFQSNVLLSKSLHISILIPMDTPPHSPVKSWFPRVSTFHSLILGNVFHFSVPSDGSTCHTIISSSTIWKKALEEELGFYAELHRATRRIFWGA
jgi:hypothetical protein